MHRTTPRRSAALALVALLGLAPLAACGDDNKSDNGAPAATQPAGGDAGTDGGSDDVPLPGNPDVDEALENVGLGNKASAIEVAIDGAKATVDGDTLRVELPAEGAMAAPELACMAIGAVLSEGEKAIAIAADGTSKEC